MKTQLTIPYQPFHFGSCNIHIISLFFIFITACSVFKEKSFYQADSLLRRNTSTEMKTEVKTHTQGLRIYTSEDSLEKQSYTEIFPEGVFRYSAKEGFNGKAKRVVINERVRGVKKVRDVADHWQEVNLKEGIKKTENTVYRVKLKEKEVKGSSYSLWFLLVLVMGLVVVYIFRGFLK